MRDYSLKDLRILEVLLEYKNVSQAANRMGMSQPAMSMALKRLRETFGDDLLIRQGNRLTLTASAQRLLPRISPLITQMNELSNDVGSFDPAISRHRFTLILTDYVDGFLIPRLYRRIRDAAPHLQLRIVGPDPFRLAEAFSGGRVDLTVTYFPAPPPELIARKLFTERLVCVTSKDNSAVHDQLSVEEFCTLTHVTIEPAEATMYRAVLDDALQKHGLALKTMIFKPDFMGLPYLLENGRLVATMPERLARMFSKRFALKVFEPPLELPPLDIKMMWHPSTHKSAPHIWLRNMVDQVSADIQ